MSNSSALWKAPIVRRLRFQGHGRRPLEALCETEWLVTNGLGGYASGTLTGASTRRYHALLVAALPAPLGRWTMLNNVIETFQLQDGRSVVWGDVERTGQAESACSLDCLAEFRLELGLPVWTFQIDRVILERRVLMPREQNTVILSHRLLSGGPVHIQLRPALNFHRHGERAERSESPPTLHIAGARYEFEFEDAPPLRLALQGAEAYFTTRSESYPDVFFRVEERRGYDPTGALWSPGAFHADLSMDRPTALIGSTEPWEVVEAMTFEDALEREHDRRRTLLGAALPQARDGVAGELVLAADQFIVTPVSRPEDMARARALGEEAQTIIAGYHWFTDWGRDTMISLEGLTLVTGRWTEARTILRTFSHYLSDGLIPNYFPEGGKEGLYHTADATLWFFHAMERYRRLTGDRETLTALLPVFEEIVARHAAGTRFGIAVDPGDGLLRQGAEGYQLTWMDAKVDDWVVTPRRGKAVEINALWYNALRLLAEWRMESGRAVAELKDAAERVFQSFNERFWCDKEGYLYDVVDGEAGDDASCRPNQVLAIALDHPVLRPERWTRVMEIVASRLLTPVGLRTLAPGHADYKPRYTGDLWARDAAYHQGTVWLWLLGPFIDAWRRTYGGDGSEIARFLQGVHEHLDDGCVGSLSEIFDAEFPHKPGGCIAQAWSVAEVLRILTTASPSPTADSPAV